MSLLYFYLVISPYILAEILRPILSYIPKKVFSFAEQLPLLWPFITGSIILKYFLILVLVGIPFIIFYFLARWITKIDKKKLKKIFSLVCGLFVLIYYIIPSLSINSIDGILIKTAQAMNKICGNDRDCKNALYTKIVKNGHYLEINGNIKKDNENGLIMPSISYLGADPILGVFADMPVSFRESYCQNVYEGNLNPLNACREKLKLAHSLLQEDCIAQAKFSYGTMAYSDYLPSLVQSCAKSFIQITPIDIVTLNSFLSAIHNSKQYQQIDNAYDTGYKGSYLEPRLTTLNNSSFAVISNLDDRQTFLTTSLRIIQTSPNWFNKYLDESWIPVVNNDARETETKRLSFEKKTIAGHVMGEEHLQNSQYSESERYRVGFVAKDIFFLIDGRNEIKDKMTSDDIRKSTERLAEHIISFLKNPDAYAKSVIPSKVNLTISPSTLNFTAKKDGFIMDGAWADYLKFTVIPDTEIAYNLQTSVDWIAVGVTSNLYQEKTGTIGDGGSTSVVLDQKATAKLPIGNYTGTITYSPANGSQFSPQTVKVNLAVVKEFSNSQSQNISPAPVTSQTGVFLASPSVINFSIKKGVIIEGSTKPEDFVMFTNNPFSAAILKSTRWKAVISGDWINAAANGTAGTAYRVGINYHAYELPVGTYSGNIIYSGDLGSELIPQTVDVTLTVTD